MADSKMCVCQYKHCLHEEDKELLKTDAVQVGKRYYHRDCYEVKGQIEELIDYFAKKLNPNVVFTVLMRTIDNIVFPKNKEGIPAERLLFQVKYFCTHGHKIQYPGGLYYALQDRESYEAYKRWKASREVGDADFSIEDDRNGVDEGRRVTIRKQRGFEDILVG